MEIILRKLFVELISKIAGWAPMPSKSAAWEPSLLFLRSLLVRHAPNFVECRLRDPETPLRGKRYVVTYNRGCVTSDGIELLKIIIERI